MALFRKSWYIVRTDLYWVSHRKEKRKYYGPFKSELSAYKGLAHMVNMSFRYSDDRHEYFVVDSFPALIYGVEK